MVVELIRVCVDPWKGRSLDLDSSSETTRWDRNSWVEIDVWSHKCWAFKMELIHLRYGCHWMISTQGKKKVSMRGNQSHSWMAFFLLYRQALFHFLCKSLSCKQDLEKKLFNWRGPIETKHPLRNTVNVILSSRYSFFFNPLKGCSSLCYSSCCSLSLCFSFSVSLFNPSMY